MIGYSATRAGFTLAELIVVIVILEVMAAVTGIALRTKTLMPIADASLIQVTAARDSALRTGQRVTVQLNLNGVLHLATAYPDGRIVTDAPIAVDALSGRGTHVYR